MPKSFFMVKISFALQASQSEGGIDFQKNADRIPLLFKMFLMFFENQEFTIEDEDVIEKLVNNYI